MLEEELQRRLDEWVSQFETEAQFLEEVPAIINNVVQLMGEAAETRGFLTANFYRQLVMFFAYMNCMFARDVLTLNKEEYMRMCEVSFDSFVSISDALEVSERRDH